jgi:hypothetical protein
MDSYEICMKLLAAESEFAVQAIIDVNATLKDPANWRPLDGRETNFNVTSNQASDGGKALTELMTNMVDAVLMKHAYKAGIEPKSPHAPSTMYEAVAKLFKWIPNGRLVNVDPNDPQLREFASKNLLIGITGAKNKKEGLPCYTFVDNGEGQRPADFTKTFLSLSEGNKKSIPFVQGKYNMGSSGVLGYCGRRWFKLIVSRRYDQDGGWGWTLMRRRPVGGMPVAEYFTLPGGKMPEFSGQPLYPFRRGTGQVYEGTMLSSGTVIKLYDYQVGARFLSFRGAREALNENLVETILPFRLLDFRQKPDKQRTGDRALGVDPRPFYGMEFLLLNSHNEGSGEGAEEGVDGDESDGEDGEDGEDRVTAEARIAVGLIQHPDLGELSITAIALKREIPSWLKKTNNRVFHTVNGQVQFKQTRGYLTECGFPALKDRIVVIVDASNLSFDAHNDVWKGDREHIRNTIVGEIYREQVSAVIRESEALKQLQLQVAKQELDRAKTDEGNDLFQKLVNSDRTLAALLTNTDPVIYVPTGGGAGGTTVGEDEFKDGRYSPTFFRLEDRVRAAPLEIPLDRTRPVTGRTDAENGYLTRAENTGRLTVPPEIAKKFALRPHLLNGKLTIFLSPLEGAVSIGDELTVRFELSDPSMPLPLSDELRVRIVDEVGPTRKKPKRPPTAPARAGKGGNKSGDGEPLPTHGLPRYKLLTKDGRNVGNDTTDPWPKDFSEGDGGFVEDYGDQGAVYKINYDNAYHIRYKQQARGDVAKEAITEKYILGMRILMLGLEHSINMTKERMPEGMGEHLDEFRKMSAKAAAAVVLALAENLPKLVDAGPSDVE